MRAEVSRTEKMPEPTSLEFLGLATLKDAINGLWHWVTNVRPLL